MKTPAHSLLACATLSLILAAPALAQVSQQQQPLTITSNVLTRCKMSAPQSTGQGTNTTFSQNGNGGEIDLTSMVDGTTAKTQAASAVIQFPIICTGPHSLTVTSQHGGMNDSATTGSAGGFVTHADYSLTASWDSDSKTFTTSGSSVGIDLSQPAPATGDLTLNFSLTSGAGPLEAGPYSDEIIVQLNAAP